MKVMCVVMGGNNNQELRIVYNIALGYWERGYSR